MIVTAFFFTDEAEQLCGPYVSVGDVTMAEEMYGKFLSGGSDAMTEQERIDVGLAMIRSWQCASMIVRRTPHPRHRATVGKPQYPRV